MAEAITTLVPNLLAAAGAAWRNEERHARSAAFHTIPRTVILGGRRHQIAAAPELAVEAAWQAVADRYEALSLDAAARRS